MRNGQCFIEKKATTLQTFTESIREKGFTQSIRVLNLEIIESNRYISRMLEIPLASQILHLRRLRVINGKPRTIERTYVCYEKVRGIEQSDFSHLSFYAELKRLFGYVTMRSEEEVLITEPSKEERELLGCEGEVMMLKGTTYLKDLEPFEYFETIAVSDFFRFQSTQEL